ncbi:MAG: hypothetical protein AAGF73_11740 [Actinomycetota bacterium]
MRTTEGNTMGVRLDEADEYLHELGPEPNFNESMYLNCFDHEQGVGGWFRIGNRANEGRAEVTVCLYLPTGSADVLPPEPDAVPSAATQRSVGFMFRRASIDNNDAFDAGGLRIDVVTPFEELRVSYSGKVLLLDRPVEMADPKAAFTSNPYAPAEIDLTFTGQGRPSMFGGEPDQPHEAPGEEFAKGHYEQLVEASGTMRVGEQEWSIHGFGLRDHSWGPRYWQAPWYYRWLTGNVDADLGFMASQVARRDGPGTRGGFVWENGTMHLCDDVELRTVTTGDEAYHQEVEAVLRSSRSDREWRVRGEATSLIPLRNRRDTPEGDSLLTRISEAYTQWTVAADSSVDTSGRDVDRVGYGMSEYLDQIIDGLPVGIDE